MPAWIRQKLADNGLGGLGALLGGGQGGIANLAGMLGGLLRR